MRSFPARSDGHASSVSYHVPARRLSRSRVCAPRRRRSIHAVESDVVLRLTFVMGTLDPPRWTRVSNHRKGKEGKGRGRGRGEDFRRDGAVLGRGRARIPFEARRDLRSGKGFDRDGCGWIWLVPRRRGGLPPRGNLRRNRAPFPSIPAFPSLSKGRRFPFHPDENEGRSPWIFLLRSPLDPTDQGGSGGGNTCLDTHPSSRNLRPTRSTRENCG